MLLKSSYSHTKVPVSILKAIALPLGMGILLLSTNQRTSAQSLWTNSNPKSPNSAIQVSLEEIGRSQQEKTEENERSRRDIPDVIIDDEKSQPDDSSSTTSTDTESEDESTPTSTAPEPEEESSTSASTEPRFTCQTVNGEYTVMYHPESRPGEAYAWAIPRQMGGGWSAERRCSEISRRLEFYRPDGLLEMRTAVENNYNTVCVTTQKNSSCRIVFTVPPGQDPMVTRDRVFENLTVADSGQQTQGVNTLVDNGRSNPILGQLGQVLGQDLSKLAMRTKSSEAINLRPFLDRADGGTGTRLQGSPFGSPNSRPQRLKPENFR
ncbi:hypothetical protein Ple7327_0113 [Pleurocapsa sp. PCC 7327]|uniref:COP23 domain-containing protein n=1 Tax=Pleurocapsa sp. PCC 7327 TaxID=118163 RepID=UPI00029FEDC2|nr:COP23 domain-containing protein [Pleurocapsa sp. PCC 7327]AFY75597.1 hypothetical protein Ple7327_0113 [Pleurocapsa sp. PCC 7327]